MTSSYLPGLMSLLTSAVGVIFGIILVRLLGPESYGIYALASAILVIAALFCDFGYSMLSIREIPRIISEDNKSLMRGFVVKSFSTLIICTLLTVLLLNISQFFLSDRLDNENFVAFKFMSVALLTYMPYKILSHFIRALKKPNRYYIYEIFRTLFVIIFILFLYSMNSSINPSKVFLSFTISNLILVFAIIIFLKKYEIFNPFGKKTIDSSWTKSGLNYIVLGSGYVILSSIDLLVIGYFLSNTDLGVYRLALLISSTIVIFLTGVDSFVAPRFSELFNKNKINELENLAKRNSLITSLPILPFFLLFYLFGDEIITFFFGAEFISSMEILLILIVGASCRVIFGSVGFILNMSGRESVTSKIIWLGCVINLALNLIFVPSFGLVGAAISTSTSLFLIYLAQYFYIVRNIGIQPSFILKIFFTK